MGNMGAMVRYWAFAFALVVCSFGASRGQRANQYNLNINNGLPSDHIYYMIKDRYGYLWFGTPNGVVRYNGYECKVFNLSNGLPTADVWSLFEDQKGRIWLGDISDELGYIYHNEYHKVKAQKEIRVFYPKSMNERGDGIIFFNVDGLSRAHYLCTTHDDSVKIAEGPVAGNLINCININETPFFLGQDSLYKAVVNDNRMTMLPLCRVDRSLTAINETPNFIATNHYALHYTRGADSISVINIHTGSKDVIKIPDISGHTEHVYLMAFKGVRGERNNINVFTDDNIAKYRDDGTFKLAGTYAISSITGNATITGGSVTSFLDDTLWGNCLATNTNGLYINYNCSNGIIYKSDLDLVNYRYAGKVSENESYWWDKASSTLACVKDNKYIKERKLPVTSDVNCIVPYSKDSLMIFFNGHANSYWYMPQSGKLADAVSVLESGVTSAIVYSPGCVYMTSIYGFEKVKWNGGNAGRKNFDPERYMGVVFDSLRQDFWAWNYDKVVIHFINDKDSIVSKDAIKRFGVKQVEKIIIDNKYGNIFFKSNEKLVIYNWEKGTWTKIFGNYNFIGASVDIYDHTLVAAGPFGILFSKITGVQCMSAPIVYKNVKNNYYNYVSGMQIAMHEVVLNTNKGLFKAAIPADSVLLGNVRTPSPKYKLIINYMDTTIDVMPGDTVLINQKKQVLTFDFINPTGNGKVKYTYRISGGDTTWHELNENVLDLPRLQAGEYTSLTIVAYDNVFRTNETVIYLYVIPYWWQTPVGRAGIIVGALALFAIAVLVTRRLVLNNQRKKNLRMEMELKSVYAQLNPHFIFNSLNSAMLMVSMNKMDEAYNHIAKFSKLLRAYLKSSKNRLIPIREEVQNLKHYIELQQVRFKNKFRYDIFVDEGIGSSVMIPSLLVQPFVENAINHGLLHKEQHGNLVIAFRKDANDKTVICTITDDGIGRAQSRLISKNDERGPSYGDDLVKDLVRIFNAYEQMNIEIKYTDIAPPLTGTRVEIIIMNRANGI